MQISKTISGSLPEDIEKIIESSLKQKADVKCEVLIVVKPGEKSETKVILTIESSVNYEDYGF